MQEKLQKLTDLTEKAKLNKTDVKNASTMLLEVHNQSEDVNQVCNFLMGLSIDVSHTFFSENYSDISEYDGVNDLITGLTNNALFKKNTRDCSIGRGIAILNVCLENKNYDPCVELLLSTLLALVIKKNSYKASFITTFNKKIISSTGVDFLKLNFKEENKDNLFYFIKQLEDSNLISTSAQEVGSIYDEYLAKKDKLVGSEPPKGKVTITDLDKSIKELQSIIGDMAKKIVELNDKIDGNTDSSTAEPIPTVSTNQDVVITDTSSSSSNDSETELLKKLLDEEKKKTSDLIEKLELSFNIDAANANQSYITLKADISDGLKHEYNRFNENFECECNNDNFYAYRGAISRMFRTLRRLGITFE